MTAHPIPRGVLSQHVVVLGKTRSGKSSTMRLMVEDLLDDQKPVCIIDPKGDWWGLKSSADGKQAGYEVVIFGGRHADVPINSHSGKVVGELVATGNRPCILDLGGWMVGDRTRFFVDFASTLFTRTHGHRWLVIDECHNFAPQGKVMDPEAGRMLHWANRLASEGAGKGVVLVSASQRPQKVHKDYLTSHETLIAKRVIHPLDRGAMKEWIDGCGDPAKGKEVLDSLAGLQRSQGWVWSPEIDFGPRLIEFPMFKTYDSFAVQIGSADRKLKGWASVDLDEVKSRLAAVVEEAKANDPALLRSEIARLKAELQKAAKNIPQNIPAADPEAIKKAEQRGFEQKAAKLTAAAEREAQAKIVAALEAVRDALAPGLTAIEAAIKAAKRERPSLSIEYSPTPIVMSRPAPIASPRLPSPAKPRAPIGDGDRPLGAERRPLAVLAGIFPAGMTEAQWAVASVLKRTGGTWSTYVSRLRTSGRIEEVGGLFYATEQGIADVGGNITEVPAPGAALVEFWATRVGGASKMLRHLASVYPGATTRDQLAADLNMAASGGTFSTYISRLRSPGLIEVAGDQLRVQPALMEKDIH